MLMCLQNLLNSVYLFSDKIFSGNEILTSIKGHNSVTNLQKMTLYPNLIIITLFQEDNIFGTDASLTYGPQLTNVDMLLKNEQTYNYLQYVQS